MTQELQRLYRALGELTTRTPAPTAADAAATPDAILPAVDEVAAHLAQRAQCGLDDARQVLDTYLNQQPAGRCTALALRRNINAERGH